MPIRRTGAVAANRHHVDGPADQPVDDLPATRPGVVLAVRSTTALRVGVTGAVTLAVIGLLARLLWYDVTSGPASGAYRLLDVDGEGTVPSWFSTLLLASCAAALWTVGTLVRGTGRRRSWPWRLLAAVFLYLSLDEAISLHEEATRPVREALGTTGVLHYSWILVAVPAVVVLLFALLPFLRELPRPTLLTFLAAGAVYVGGAVGMEMISGILGSRSEQGTTPWHVVVSVEELLEMLGAALFLAAVSRHRERYVDRSQPV